MSKLSLYVRTQAHQAFYLSMRVCVFLSGCQSKVPGTGLQLIIGFILQYVVNFESWQISYVIIASLLLWTKDASCRTRKVALTGYRGCVSPKDCSCSWVTRVSALGCTHSPRQKGVRHNGPPFKFTFIVKLFHDIHFYSQNLSASSHFCLCVCLAGLKLMALDLPGKYCTTEINTPQSSESNGEIISLSVYRLKMLMSLTFKLIFDGNLTRFSSSKENSSQFLVFIFFSCQSSF